MSGAAITGKDLQRIHEELKEIKLYGDHASEIEAILDRSDDLDSELDRRFEDGQEAGEVSGSERTWEEVCDSLKGGWMGFARNLGELEGMFEEIASIVSNVRYSFERKEALEKIGAMFAEVIG